MRRKTELILLYCFTLVSSIAALLLAMHGIHRLGSDTAPPNLLVPETYAVLCLDFMMFCWLFTQKIPEDKNGSSLSGNSDGIVGKKSKNSFISNIVVVGTVVCFFFWALSNLVRGRGFNLGADPDDMMPGEKFGKTIHVAESRLGEIVAAFLFLLILIGSACCAASDVMRYFVTLLP